jgi:trehalose utilization protein
MIGSLTAMDGHPPKPTGAGTAASRRDFLKASSLAAGGLMLPATGRAADDQERPIKVVVWDERQPAQMEVYENFLGNAIAEHLRAQPGLEVESVALDDPEQGLSAKVLDGCRVLIWWGHVRNGDVSPEVGRRIVERITGDGLSLIALHSAHWSSPFVEAMNELARREFERRVRAEGLEQVTVREVPPPRRFTLPKADERVTPFVELRKFPDGPIKADLHLPYCCFPAYRTDGKPSQVRVLRPEHPIMAGVPKEFTIARTEMYDEPFHVPSQAIVLF